MESLPEPDVVDGIEYWNTQPASLDGVLGGYGSGTLPRIDALGSRLFLLNLFPELSTVPSAIRPLSPQVRPRTRALDVGAGIGRVTADVLLHLVSDVVLLEPVDSFVQEALARGRASTSLATRKRGQDPWKGIADQTKSVTILQGTLQEFDPLKPHRAKFLDRVGFQPLRPADDIDMGFDVIWCQWCLGHLSDRDLISFFRRSHDALRDKGKGRSLIVVKENLCQDMDDGSACTLFDEQDSSLTRSDQAWKNIFRQAGLSLVAEQVQEGLPEGLYVVKMYGLR
ncbi:Alpha N-terminal protein methyltransferase 1 [Hypsizygus marmoreus]|uniref:Alpha N-terminal protein methyltransferase 1 n=1 Tax=Hypsizygus marmoreus TaxID=39966 RepID=A0A369JIU1_HYPMA|nr:Alpha N-terminal protein methyltransferase 1 [Hypsizygus marmoreus]